jgi:hypothetical protein
MRSSNDVTKRNWNGEGSRPRNFTPIVQRKLGGLSVGPQLPKNPLSSTTVTSGLPVIRPEPRNLESLLSALFGKYNSTQSTRSATLRKPIHVSPPASNLLPCSNPHTNRHNRLQSPPTLIKYPLNRGRRICNCSRTGAVPATVTAPPEQRHRNQTHQSASPLFAQ